ncbi:MAG: flagellar export protein FliJ [Thermogutta sp.]
MRKFTFRLATILKLREQEREERKRDLQQAYAAREILFQQQSALAIERQNLSETLRKSLLQGNIDADQMLACRRYETVLNAQRDYLSQQMSVIDKEIEKRQQALVEANRAVRILELLREKQRIAHEKEEATREIKALDEIGNRKSRDLYEP